MGRGVMAGRWPIGEAIDRAARLVAAPSPRGARHTAIAAGRIRQNGE